MPPPATPAALPSGGSLHLCCPGVDQTCCRQHETFHTNKGLGRGGRVLTGLVLQFMLKKNLVELLFWVKQCHLHNLIHLNPLLPICPDCSKCPNPVTSPCISAPLHSRPRWLSDLLAPDRAQNISPKLRFGPKKGIISTNSL